MDVTCVRSQGLRRSWSVDDEPAIVESLQKIFGARG